MRVGLENQNAVESQPGSAVSPRLVKAAQEFEAQMMKELLQPMTAKDTLTGDEADGSGDAGATGALGEFASESLGQAISRHGGFGIAQQIVHELSRSGHKSSDGKSVGFSKRILR